MNDTSTVGNSTPPPEQEPAPATSAHVLRQLAVIVVVIIIWSALLYVYLVLTDTSEEAPAATPTSAERPQVSFSQDVLPVFESRCQRCHGTSRAEAGLSLASHADVIAGSNYGPVVTPGSAETSRLVQVVVSGEMPRGGAKLPQDDTQTILDWVDAGAPDN